MAILWRESLETGVKEIDDQHKELFKAVNRLLDACGQGKGKEEVGSVIKFLEDYVVTHFTAEEKLQKESHYPEFDFHKQQHAEFIKSFAEIKKQFETEGVSMHFVPALNRMVVDWLVKHIGSLDKALGTYLKSKI